MSSEQIDGFPLRILFDDPVFLLIAVNGPDEGCFNNILDLKSLACGDGADLLQDTGIDNCAEPLLVAGLLQRFLPESVFTRRVLIPLPENLFIGGFLLYAVSVSRQPRKQGIQIVIFPTASSFPRFILSMNSSARAV